MIEFNEQLPSDQRMSLPPIRFATTPSPGLENHRISRFFQFWISCFVTTKSGNLRDDACGDGRAGGEGSFKVDAALGYTFGIDNVSGLGGAGAQVVQRIVTLSSARSVIRSTRANICTELKTVCGRRMAGGRAGGKQADDPKLKPFSGRAVCAGHKLFFVAVETRRDGGFLFRPAVSGVSGL